MFWKIKNYRVFQGFGQAKFPDGGSILGSSQLSLLSKLPQFKSGQNRIKKKSSRFLNLNP